MKCLICCLRVATASRCVIDSRHPASFTEARTLNIQTILSRGRLEAIFSDIIITCVKPWITTIRNTVNCCFNSWYFLYLLAQICCCNHRLPCSLSRQHSTGLREPVSTYSISVVLRCTSNGVDDQLTLIMLNGAKMTRSRPDHQGGSRHEIGRAVHLISLIAFSHTGILYSLYSLSFVRYIDLNLESL